MSQQSRFININPTARIANDCPLRPTGTLVEIFHNRTPVQYSPRSVQNDYSDIVAAAINVSNAIPISIPAPRADVSGLNATTQSIRRSSDPSRNNSRQSLNLGDFDDVEQRRVQSTPALILRPMDDDGKMNQSSMPASIGPRSRPKKASMWNPPLASSSTLVQPRDREGEADLDYEHQGTPDKQLDSIFQLRCLNMGTEPLGPATRDNPMTDPFPLGLIGEHPTARLRRLESVGAACCQPTLPLTVDTNSHAFDERLAMVRQFCPYPEYVAVCLPAAIVAIKKTIRLLGKANTIKPWQEATQGQQRIEVLCALRKRWEEELIFLQSPYGQQAF